MDKVIVDNRIIKPKHWRIGGVALVVIVAILFMSTRNYTSTYKIDRDKVQFTEVFEGNFEDFIKVNGRVEPISTIFMDAIEGGRVEEILITEGNMVKKGDVILRMSNNNLNLSILNSEAQLAEKSNFLREVMLNMEQQKLQTKRELINLNFQLKKRKRDYERSVGFFKDDLISKEDFLIAEDSYLLSKQLFELMVEKQKQDSLYRTIQIDQMNQNLDNMKRNLELVHQRIDNLNVKAAFDGQLGMLNAEIGQLVSPGQRIGQINILTSYKITAEIDEHYIDRVIKDLTASFERDTNEYNLKVKKVYPEVRAGRFQIDLVFQGQMPLNIRTGQTYYVDLQLGDPQQRLQISKGGFYNSTGGQWIYILDESESFATRKEIKIGRQNPGYYEVLEGLKVGDKVIVSSYEIFGENERIILK